MKKFLTLAFFLFVAQAIIAGNPSYEKARRGQVSYADDQIVYFSGILAPGAVATITVPIEQNYFSYSSGGSTSQVSISLMPANYNNGDSLQFVPGGPKVSIDILLDEVFNLSLERPTGSFFVVKNTGATSLSYRLVITGRDDYVVGVVK